MRPRSLQEVYGEDLRRFHDDLDAILDDSLGPRGPGFMFDLAGKVGLTSKSNVLDVGCRDGRQLLDLHRRFGCRGVGIEPFAVNLARAPADIKNTPVVLVQGVVQSLPFAGASFDFVWIRDVLVHVEPLTAAFAECRRVLRPGAPVVLYQMFATPLLEPDEAARLWQSLAVVPETTDQSVFEKAIETAGLRIEQRHELGSEWREYQEEQEDSRTSRQLLRAARLLREPERYKKAFGDRAYSGQLANCLWGVYQMIGKLSPAIYVLR